MATKGSTKVPLREIATLFTNLGANTKAQLLSAFGEAESLLNFHNQSTIDKQEKRVLSSLVDSPVVTATTNSRGLDVQWERLDDRYISSYEVQVSFDSIFSNPDAYNIVNTSLSLEGIGTTVYIRVRGVRFDGQCGPWSDSVQVDALASVAGPVIYTRGYTDAFYTTTNGYSILDASPGPIQHIRITPSRQNGGIVVFGSVGLHGYNTTPGDYLQVKINSTTVVNYDLGAIDVVESYGPSLAFGPAFLTHEGFNFSAADGQNPGTATESGSGSGTFSGWNTLSNATGTAETVYPATSTTYSQGGLEPGDDYNSKYLHLTNWGLTTPAANTVIGLELTIYTSWFPINLDPSKSKTFLRNLQLIDNNGAVRTYDRGSTSTPWPRDTSTGAGDPLGTITYGGPTDLWGESAGYWTPTVLNDTDFGVRLRARFKASSTDSILEDANNLGLYGTMIAQVYGASLTVYSINENLEADIAVYWHSTNDTFLDSCTLNVIEFGSAIS